MRIKAIGPYLWYHFTTLGRLARTEPRGKFYRRYGLLYSQRRSLKMRGSIALEEFFRDTLRDYDWFWTSGPHPQRHEEWFTPQYVKPLPVAFTRRKSKRLNTYQALRNLEIRR